MRKKIYFLILALLPNVSSLLAFELSKQEIKSDTQAFSVTYTIGSSDISKNYPNGEPQEEKNPPISIYKAVEIAKNEAKETLKIAKHEWAGGHFGYAISEVKLQQIPMSRKWCYLITIYTMRETKNEGGAVAIPDGFFIPEFVSIPVYFDEKVPLAKIEKNNHIKAE